MSDDLAKSLVEAAEDVQGRPLNAEMSLIAAAAYIKALQAENARLREALSNMEDERDRFAARAEHYRAALEGGDE